MTPDLDALARQLPALPGWPDRLPGALVLADGEGPRRMAWGPTPEGAYPDLDDAATVGVLLGLLPVNDYPVSLSYEPAEPHVEGLPDVPASWGVSVVGGDAVPGSSRRKRTRGATLGEAAARALVAVGRCAP